ncbi:SDR family NAD(P)-dependent oxidoreductase [Duganella sp. FT135W]|uniref:SDR family NAD(P)-dependent oxidoreductase n=1 Tax=Duganella flavida TaxID=2692175 RepID=A0A6L8K548_9BURK|nr:SDR family NAD(P)-dependent oxidoreductase [Duganella flavida]
MKNRVAVITGASSGIGFATAKLLAARGAKVAVLARRKEVLDELVKDIRAAGGEAIALAVDVTNQASVDAAAAAVDAAYGPAIEPGITETELQGHWTFQGAKDRPKHGVPAAAGHCRSGRLPGHPAEACELATGGCHANQAGHVITSY